MGVDEHLAQEKRDPVTGRGRVVRRFLSARLAMLAAASLLALPSIADSVEAPEGVPLRLAMSGTFRPFSATDETGTLVGFDADIAREVARRMGRPPELVQIDWAGIQAGLQNGKYDLICASMAITPRRRETMLFSLPYYVSGAQIYARNDLEEIRGVRIGVTEDSTYETWIDEHPDLFPDVTVLRYGSEAESIVGLRTEKIDAFISDRIVGRFYIREGGAGEIVPFGDLLYREAIGIAARKDSAELIHGVNQALFAIIQDGTYSRIYRRWVGVDPDVSELLVSWSEYHEAIPDLSGDVASEPSAPRFAHEIPVMLQLLARGARLTIVLSLLTGVLALLTGSLLGIGTISRAALVRKISNGYIWIVRGTPLLVQLFISYFGIATVANHVVGFEVMGAFGAALLALVVNTTAYNAETIRGGIVAVDSGQWDAAASIGMHRSLILRRIILPQAFRDSLPSLGNNLVVLIKDTSLVGAITLVELTYAARNVVFQTGRAFVPFIAAAVFYLVIVSVVTIGVRQWERHLQRSRVRTRSGP